MCMSRCLIVSRGLYYLKHRDHTWIRKSHKATKALVVDFVLSITVVTIVSMMNKKINVIPTS